jgi:hypothetical protein
MGRCNHSKVGPIPASPCWVVEQLAYMPHDELTLLKLKTSTSRSPPFLFKESKKCADSQVWKISYQTG